MLTRKEPDNQAYKIILDIDVRTVNLEVKRSTLINALGSDSDVSTSERGRVDLYKFND